MHPAIRSQHRGQNNLVKIKVKLHDWSAQHLPMRWTELLLGASRSVNHPLLRQTTFISYNPPCLAHSIPATMAILLFFEAPGICPPQSLCTHCFPVWFVLFLWYLLATTLNSFWLYRNASISGKPSLITWSQIQLSSILYIPIHVYFSFTNLNLFLFVVCHSQVEHKHLKDRILMWFVKYCIISA